MTTVKLLCSQANLRHKILVTIYVPVDRKFPNAALFFYFHADPNVNTEHTCALSENSVLKLLPAVSENEIATFSR